MLSSKEGNSAVTVTHSEDHNTSKRRKVGPAHYDFDRVDRKSLATGQLQDTLSVPPHPLGVRPLGNAWDAKVNIKSHSGTFFRLPDVLLLAVLEYLPVQDLVVLGSTCKALYAFSKSEELWKNLFLENPPSRDFVWRSTWRDTLLNLPPDRKAAVQCSGLFSDVLYRPWQCANLALVPQISNIPQRNAIARLPDLTSEEYNTHWVSKPFILTEPVKQWHAYQKWSIEYLLSEYAETTFRAEAVDWPFNTYVSYMRNNTDESPLYLFDCQFATKMGIHVGKPHETPSATQAAYTPPTTFDPDLFELLAPHRPDHAWLIIGPARSGSTFHSDPNGTSAWNAVLRGAKYWLMFPPPTSPSHSGIPGVHLSEDLSHITAPLSLSEYLLTFHAEARRTPGCVEGICREGEILHVPAGWYHMVVNLEDGVALTQNFVSRAGLVGCLQFLRDRRDQVSGFHWEDYARLNGDSKPEADSGKYGEGTEYELFVARLREQFPDLLERSLVDLENRDRHRLHSETKSKWASITERNGPGWEIGESGRGQSFSFGFGDEDENEDEDEESDESDRIS